MEEEALRYEDDIVFTGIHGDLDSKPTSKSQMAHTCGVMLFKRSPTRPDFEVDVNIAHTNEQHWYRVRNGLQHPVHTAARGSCRSSKSRSSERGCGEAQRNCSGNVVHSEKTDLERSPHSDALNMQPRDSANVYVKVDQCKVLGSPNVCGGKQTGVCSGACSDNMVRHWRVQMDAKNSISQYENI